VVDPVEYKVRKVVVGPGDDDHIVVRHAGCHLFCQLVTMRGHTEEAQATAVPPLLGSSTLK
jgi:ribosomal protein L18